MERKYTLLAILVIVLALGLVVLPKSNGRKEIDPKVLLDGVVERSRFLSVDQVTHRIIENDPSLELIDLRPADQFKTFALPGSINLNPDSLLSPYGSELLGEPGKDKVLYGNSDLIAEKAWLVCSRYSINRLYIMKGGMNEWFTTIIKVQQATGTPSTTDLDLISFRNAARQFFVGSGTATHTPIVPVQKEKAPLIRKAPSSSAGGGC
ncbi:MAG: rhodanese-like domain-containing protein [Prolixibacteraceae bacterium]|jgi:rhodanese-related sulfurtransferase|nr:rhodanese-like domain-containing protein [Prolixibacteraceae bacterium]